MLTEHIHIEVNWHDILETCLIVQITCWKVDDGNFQLSIFQGKMVKIIKRFGDIASYNTVKKNQFQYSVWIKWKKTNAIKTRSVANKIVNDTCVVLFSSVSSYKHLGSYFKNLLVYLSVNIAQGKSTQQSSTWSWPSKNAVDGKPRTCSFTYKDNDPWWRVDLGSSRTVKKVALINRHHANYKRLANFEIRVGMIDSRPKQNSLWVFESSKSLIFRSSCNYCQDYRS